MYVLYLSIIGLIIGSYFFGNINFSIIISHFLKRDVRREGSGNPGTMNMLRNFGVKLGALTLVLDAIKGAVPAIIGLWLIGGTPDNPMAEMMTFGNDKTGLFIAGISVVIGHIFPVLYKFKGGKGVASSIGVCFVASPIVTAVAFAIGLVFMFTVKIGSLTSFIITGIPLIYCGVYAILSDRIAEGVLSLCIYAIILCAHHANFVRIFTGKEKQTVLFGKNKSAKKNTPQTDIGATEKIDENKTEEK